MRRMDRRRCVRACCGRHLAGLCRPSRGTPAPPSDGPRSRRALVVEAASGKVIYARNAAATRHPASLTKLMTLYLLFEALRAKKLMLQTEIPVSAYAASQPRAHLRLKPGWTITVETAIKAMIIQSANDVAVAVAEAVGGNEGVFVVLMNAKAGRSA